MRWRRFVFGFAIYGMVELALNSDGQPTWYRVVRAVGVIAMLWYGAGGWKEQEG